MAMAMAMAIGCSGNAWSIGRNSDLAIALTKAIISQTASGTKSMIQTSTVRNNIIEKLKLIP